MITNKYHHTMAKKNYIPLKVNLLMDDKDSSKQRSPMSKTQKFR